MNYDKWLQRPLNDKEEKQQRMDGLREFIRYEGLHDDPDSLSDCQIENIIATWETNQYGKVHSLKPKDK